jgi:hypothetical protein
VLLLLTLAERPSNASSLNTSRNLMRTSLGRGATMYVMGRLQGRMVKTSTAVLLHASAAVVIMPSLVSTKFCNLAETSEHC